jgi:hypothetical protein
MLWPLIALSIQRDFAAATLQGVQDVWHAHQYSEPSLSHATDNEPTNTQVGNGDCVGAKDWKILSTGRRTYRKIKGCGMLLLQLIIITQIIIIQIIIIIMYACTTELWLMIVLQCLTTLASLPKHHGIA